MRYKALVYFFSIIFIADLFYMQVIKHSESSRMAMKNIVRVEPLPASRGVIYDRDGNILAESYPVFMLLVYPALFGKEQRDFLLKTGIVSEELFKRKYKRKYSVIRMKRLSKEEVAMIEENCDKLPGVRVKIEPVRFYAYDSITSHVLGYTGEISEDEISQKKLPLQRGAIIGKRGVERRYDEFLRGVDGVEYWKVDALGRFIGKAEGIKDIPPVKGADAYITIDIKLQRYVDSLFSRYRKGAAVAINPSTGEILLYYSKPGFPVNEIVYHGNDLIWKDLVSSPDGPLFDRVLKGQYPPGSIFKVITAAIGLKEGIVNEHTRFKPCNGGIYIGNKYMACWSKHGSLDLIDAIIRSCDVYFYQLGMNIGLSLFSKDARELGFGRPTGVDMDGEKPGLIPDSAWFNAFYGRRNWGKGVVANLAIGQGEILVTPLQVVKFFAGLVNGGKAPVPYIVKKIVNNRGEVIYSHKNEYEQLLVDTSVLSLLKKATIGVVENPEGTAHWIRLPDIVIGGKTGTAQNPHGKDHSLFVGYAPAEKPEIVVFVVVENAGHGSTVAAPIAARIIKRYIEERRLING